MSANVIDLITADHRRLEELFERLRGRQQDRTAAVHQVERLLTAHSRAEEERVYPVVAKEAPGEKGQVRHSEEEHREADELVRRLRAADPRDDAFDTLATQLIEAVTHHVRTEEGEVLPAPRDAVDAERLRELGTAFSRRRKEVLDHFGPDGHGQDTLHRDELYAEAREADIPGRSTMNKDELADAVHRAHRQG